MYELRHWTSDITRFEYFELTSGRSVQPLVTYVGGQPRGMRCAYLDDVGPLPTQLACVHYTDAHVTTTSIWR